MRTTGNILVVDDVSANVELLRRTLTSESYSTLVASDGHTGADDSLTKPFIRLVEGGHFDDFGPCGEDEAPQRLSVSTP